MNIVVTGATGLLSTELKKIDNNIQLLGSIHFDITQKNIILKIKKLNPDIIIHAAAITNSMQIKVNPLNAIRTNIIGTGYLSQYCLLNNKRLVYISTDYVYPGDTGNYHESDPILPHNEYAWSKLGGECSVKLVPNHLIIRTSFGANEFPYEYAWNNLITSKDYVDIMAPMIYKAAVSNITGILNIGTPAKTMYEYAKQRNNIISASLENKKDFSLNFNRYEQSFNN